MYVKEYCFSVYITTNASKSVFYIGVTNDLEQRVTEHYLSRGNNKTFAGKYFCYWLIYYEDFNYVDDAIEREKELKKWNRHKKEKLIETFNPSLQFLNVEICDQWPPENLFHRKDL